MKRGEVWWIGFDPAIGGEIRKTRPAVIISNNISNEKMNRMQVVPLSSNIAKVYPCEALVSVNGKTSKAMADQMATVSKLRVKDFIAMISAEDMEAVESAVRLQLGLPQH